MTDRELLELAAKAAFSNIAFKYTEESEWNPLTNDGDALRLAVKLGLVLDLRYTDPMAMKHNCVSYWRRGEEGSPYKRIAFDDHLDAASATRRAIVLAAAEIGRK